MFERRLRPPTAYNPHGSVSIFSRRISPTPSAEKAQPPS